MKFVLHQTVDLNRKDLFEFFLFLWHLISMKILLVNKVFLIHNMYSYIESYCKDYLCDCDHVDYSISIRMSDILYEKEKSRREDIKEGIPIREFSDAYLETLAVYRKICRCLLDENVLLFHGSVVSVDGIGYLFTAKSGTGKSTHTKYWREYFKDRAIMINDDKPLLEIKEDCVNVYGTPWDGKHRLSTNTCVPLKAICILNRGKDNHICRIDGMDAYSMLIQQVNRPVGDAVAMCKTLELIDLLCSCVEFYSMHCTMDIDAARVAYEGMKGL